MRNGTHDAYESVFTLDDIDHFITMAPVDDSTVEACIGPRDTAERVLNLRGLSTYELFD